MADQAARRLVRRGRRAIPSLETALHTAGAEGRLRCVGALAAIGDPEVVPLLGHLSTWDEDERVRAAARATLARWAGESGERAVAARAALGKIGPPRP